MVKDYDVILATFNGSRFIIELLDSILNQTIPPKSIYISDDNSQDDTISLIINWSRCSSIPVYFLPCPTSRLGSSRNFERLLPIPSSTFVMLADQDDVWDINKAESLLAMTYDVDPMLPLLVHSDMRVVGVSGKLISKSFYDYQFLDPCKNDFLSLSLQNTVAGCSCMVNQRCIQAALPFPQSTIMHDWWLALIASRCGIVKFWSGALLSYRQHDSNVVGAQGYLKQILSRLSQSSTKYIEQSIAMPVYQLQECVRFYPFSDPLDNLYIRNLSHCNPFNRLKSSLLLGLRKHGILRTFFFYSTLLLWFPNSKSR